MLTDDEIEEKILQHPARISAVALVMACEQLAQLTRNTKAEIQEKIVIAAIRFVAFNSEEDTLCFLKQHYPLPNQTNEN